MRKRQDEDFTKEVHKAERFERMVRGLIARDARAASDFVDQFGKLISCLVWRLMGADTEHDDMVNQVYVNIFASITSIRDTAALESWVTGVTIHTVQKEFQRRRVRRIFVHIPDAEERLWVQATPERSLLLKLFYQILDHMRAPVRVVFTLYYVEGYTLAEIPPLCHASLTTVKRRLRAGKKVFQKWAGRHPELQEWMKEQDHER